MINLGDKVIDKISKFTGIAVASTVYLHGCRRISVQPEVNEKGELPDWKSFDEPQLEIIEKTKIKKLQQDPDGGPEKYLSNRDDYSKR